MKNSRRIRALAALVFLSLAALPAQARPDLCEDAARLAAAEVGMPADVLLAIALTETGRAHGGTVRPWPWAVNLEGRGHWFDSPAQALAFAESALAAGRTGFDLGCFQINWHWHGAHFANPRALLDPLAGARYAAAFLAGLAQELGSWERAAGAYHSRRPHLAARYRARFEAHRARLAGHPPAPAPPPVPPPVPRRVNTYPLLVAAGTAASAPLASLMPAGQATTAFLPALHEHHP